MLGGGFGATSIDLAGFTLTKAGSGAFHLTNTTFTAGSLSIQGGTVFLNAVTENTGTNTSLVNVSLANTAGASLGLNGKSLTVASLSGGGATGGNVTLGAGTLTLGNASSTTYSGVISGSGGLVKQGSGTLTLTRANTYSGGLTVSEGIVRLGASAGFGGTTSTVGSGTLTIQAGAAVTTLNSFAISGITGAGNTRVVNVAGTLTLGETEYIQTYNLTGGSLIGPTSGSGYIRASEAGLFLNSLASANAATITGRVDLTFASLTVNTAEGAAVDDLLISAVISENSGAGSGNKTLTKLGSGTLALTGANTYSGGTNLNAGGLEFASGSLGSTGTVTLAAGTLLRWASGNTQDISSRLAFSGSTALDTNGNDVSLGSALSGGPSLILTKSGAGTLTLSGASSGLSSGWTLTAGTLKAGHVQAFGTGAIRVEGGVLDLNGLAVTNVFSLAGGSVTGFTSLDASQLDFSSNAAPKLSGVIAGELDLANKAVDATGGLTAAGTLKGDGAVFSGGTVTLDNGAIHAPGSSPGTQTFESGLTYAAGATLDWEIELDPADWAAATPQRGPDYDAINVTGGDLVIGSGAMLLVTLLDPLGASFNDLYWDELRILQAINFSSVGQITGAFSLDASAANAAAYGRGEWSMTQDGSGVYLQWTPVPEPSTYGLILGGLALAGAALRRRRKVS